MRPTDECWIDPSGDLNSGGVALAWAARGAASIGSAGKRGPRQLLGAVLCMVKCSPADRQ